MTKKFNMSKGERFEVTEKKVKNLEMAQRVSQMLIKQIGESVSPMAKDVGELAGRQRELQYQLLAIRELAGLTLEAVNELAEQLQVKDFSEASDKEDAEKAYTVGEEVTDDSIVVLTSKTDTGTGGILRSKLVVKDIGFPELRKDLLGKKVGETITADVNGVIHTITVLAIRNAPAPVVQLAPPPTEAVSPLIPVEENATYVRNDDGTTTRTS